MAIQSFSLLHVIRTMAGVYKEDRRTDAELLSHYAQTHDQTAFAILMTRHGPMVWAICRKLLGNDADAEDAHQIVFMALARGAHTIRAKDSLASWLCQVARRSSLHSHRAKRSQKRIQEQLRSQGAPAFAVEAIDAAQDETSAVLWDELTNLPEKQRVVLVLHYMEGRTQADIAEILGVKEPAVWTRLARAKVCLQQRLTQRGLALGAAALTTLLRVTDSHAAMSHRLVGKTVKAATAFRDGEISGGLARLATELLKQAPTAPWWKTGWTILILCFTGLGVGAGGVAWKAGLFGDGAHRPAPAGVTSVSQKLDQAKAKPPRLDVYGDPLPEGALARLGTVRFRCNSSAVMGFTPDGKALLTAPTSSFSDDQDACLWDAKNGRLLRQFRTPFKKSHLAGGAALSSDGKLVVSRSSFFDGNAWVDAVYVWETATGKITFKLITFKREPSSQTINKLPCAFPPDGKSLIAWNDGNLGFWDLTTGKARWKQASGEAVPLAVSSDGKLLAQGSKKGVVLRDVQTGRILRQLGLNRPVDGLSFSPANRTLLVGYQTSGPRSKHYSVYMWDVVSGKESWRLDEEKHRYGYASFDPAGKVVAVCGGEKGVILVDSDTGKELRRCQHKRVQPWTDNPLTFSPDGKVIAAADCGVIQYWDAANGMPLGPQDSQGHEDGVCSVSFSADGKTLISAGFDQAVHVWDAWTGRKQRSLREEVRLRSLSGTSVVRLTPRAVAISSDGKTVACPCYDYSNLDCSLNDWKDVRISIGLWDAGTGRETRRIQLDCGPSGDSAPSGVVFSPDGKFLSAYSTIARGVYDPWKVATGKQLKRGIAGCEPVFSPDGATMATCVGKDFVFWRTSTGERIGSVKTGDILDVTVNKAIAPDWQTLAVERDVYLLNWEQEFSALLSPYPYFSICTLDDTDGRRGRMIFSPDGKLLASTDESFPDCAVYLWETATGKRRARFVGHSRAVNALSFSPNGRRIASASDDKTILVWDAAGGRLNDSERLPPVQLSLEQIERLWAVLAGDSEVEAVHHAIWAFVAASNQTIAFFKKHLPLTPFKKASAQRVAQLIEALDYEQFKVRQKAIDELRKMGGAAELLLRQALAKKPSLETRRRLEELLAAVAKARHGKPSSETLRHLRAIEVLEHIGGQDAGQLLETLAQGDPTSRRTREARAALARLKRSENWKALHRSK